MTMKEQSIVRHTMVAQGIMPSRWKQLVLVTGILFLLVLFISFSNIKLEFSIVHQSALHNINQSYKKSMDKPEEGVVHKGKNDNISADVQMPDKYQSHPDSLKDRAENLIVTVDNVSSFSPKIQENSNLSSGTFVYEGSSLYQAVISIHDALYKKPEKEMCQHRTPGAYIVGVAKSGTRELIDFLAMHPQIKIFRNKENKSYLAGKRMLLNEQTRKTFARRMPCTYSDQIGLVKSDGFFYKPDVPMLLKTLNQKLKVIVIVREPISRLISQVTFRYRKHITKPTYPKPSGHFQETAQHKLGIDRYIMNEHGKLYNTSFLLWSKYDECLERYLKVFPREQIMVIEANEFKTNPAVVFNSVTSFLGLKTIPVERYFVFNEAKGFYCIRFHSDINKIACFPDCRGRRNSVQLKPRTKHLLKEYFSPHNEKFFQLLGKRYDWQFH